MPSVRLESHPVRLEDGQEGPAKGAQACSTALWGSAQTPTQRRPRVRLFGTALSQLRSPPTRRIRRHPSRTLRSHPDHTHAVEPATAATPAAPPVRVAAATGSLSPPGAGQQRLADSESERPGRPLLNRAQTQSINLSFILMIQLLILLSRRSSEAPCPQVGYCALRMRKKSSHRD